MNCQRCDSYPVYEDEILCPNCTRTMDGDFIEFDIELALARKYSRTHPKNQAIVDSGRYTDEEMRSWQA